ncbi:MAG: DUF928 domain-containing protein [Symploca sp. SIO3C6]|nr:DUF928 domain-containing protein [Symploca sp. SIO3C6]
MKKLPAFALISTVVFLIDLELASAQSFHLNSFITQDPVPTILFNPPPKDEKPDKTTGAGSRDERQCSQDTQNNFAQTLLPQPALQALVPNDNYGVTFSERPTLWVYIPETSAKQIVLSLKEEGIKHHSQIFLPITGISGIFGFKLGEESPPLEIGKSYQWAVVMVCGDQPSPNDPVTTAWIKRITPLQPLDDSLSWLEQAVWYGKQGIWYDALTALAQARQLQPNNSKLMKDWADFLSSVELKAIATEPLEPITD